MARLALSLLGPFRATLKESPLTHFATDKIRALLAYLAVEADKPHRRDMLATLLWPQRPDKTARRNLRQSLHRLKQTLDKAVPGSSQRLLTITRQTVQLNGQWLELDMATFRELLQTCEAHRHRHLHTCSPCLKRMAQAVALYQGEFLQGFSLADVPAFEEWLLVQREMLHYQMLVTLYSLAAAYERRAAYDLAHEYAARQVALEPWREEAHRQLMRALALDGQRSQALAQYETCCRILEEELGVAPTAETTTLYEQIRDEVYQEPATKTAASLPAPPLLHHFPVQFTPFIGRETELAQILGQLTNPACRLLTLCGPGGIGKTRLSARAAESAAAKHLDFEDGIYFVPLASVAAPDLLVTAVAGNLGLIFHESETPRQQLLNYLHPKKLLLVLDNFEHLLEDVSLLVDILSTAPHVTILATSREPLNLRAEWLMLVEGLPCPPAKKTAKTVPPTAYSAVQLFLQAASRAQVGFSPTPQEETAVVHICRLVQGIPLAIEIAATWIRCHDCTTIAQEIARSLDFLVTPLRDMPPRHRSMRAVFEHSWELLSQTEQTALAQVSVFRGGFTLRAALAVTVATASELSALVSKSLLGRGEQERYELHKLLRQFAAEKLTTAQEEGPGKGEIWHRHSRFYLELLEQEETASGRGSQTLQNDLDNIRQAWQWATAQPCLPTIERSLKGLAHFYRLKGLVEEGERMLQVAVVAVQNLLQTAESTPANAAITLSRLLVYRARFLTIQGHYEEATAAAQTALALAESQQAPHCQALAQSALGELLQLQGEYDQALAYLQEARSFYGTMGDSRETAAVLSQLGVIYWHKGKHDEALDHYRQALAINRRLRHQAGIATVMSRTGLVYKDKGEYDEALQYYQEALQIDRELGHKAGIAQNTGNMGMAYRFKGEYRRALQCYEEALQIDRELGHKVGVARNTGNMGLIYKIQGNYDQALACYEQSLHIFRELGHRRGIAISLGNMANIYANTGRYDQALARYRQALQIDRQTGQEIGIAIRLGNIGDVYKSKEAYGQALAHYEEAIELLGKLGARHILLEAMLNKAEVLLLREAYRDAQALTEKALQMTADLGLPGNEFFKGRVLAARIAFALHDKESARRQLHEMLNEQQDEPRQAELHYELWRMGQGETHAQVARKLYRRLYGRTPHVEYHRRLRALGEEEEKAS